MYSNPNMIFEDIPGGDVKTRFKARRKVILEAVGVANFKAKT